MNYAALKKTDVANGEGVRVSLFVSGCSHHCKGCFNQEAWDFSAGKKFDSETYSELISALDHDYISGLSILGGEPLDPKNQGKVHEIMARVKRRFPSKTIWLYTGYSYDQVRSYPGMSLIDVLVDGPFVEEQKDITLLFRGSSNQRLIDIQKTRAAGKIILWDSDKDGE